MGSKDLDQRRHRAEREHPQLFPEPAIDASQPIGRIAREDLSSEQYHGSGEDSITDQEMGQPAESQHLTWQQKLMIKPMERAPRGRAAKPESRSGEKRLSSRAGEKNCNRSENTKASNDSAYITGSRYPRHDQPRGHQNTTQRNMRDSPSASDNSTSNPGACTPQISTRPAVIHNKDGVQLDTNTGMPGVDGRVHREEDNKSSSCTCAELRDYVIRLEYFIEYTLSVQSQFAWKYQDRIDETINRWKDIDQRRRD